jgi:hypothetical protein
MIDVDRVIKDLNLKSFGQKGWLSNKTLACPICGKTGKFGLKLTKEGGTANCFYCEDPWSIYKYLRFIGRPDLIIGNDPSVIYDKKLSLFRTHEIEGSVLKDAKLPVGFTHIDFDSYLEERLFTKEQYDIFHVGISTDIKLKNYLVFPLYDHQRLVGWLARSKYSKEWHKANLEAYKQGKERLVQRYHNSTGTDFEKIVGGIDEITDEVTTAIVVEGLFDKAGVDRNLDLQHHVTMKCIYTFGNKMSDNQLIRLRQTKLKNLILLYDYGTTKQLKKYGLMCDKYYKVKIGEIKDPAFDPGDMSQAMLLDILSHTLSPIEFFARRLRF